MVRSLRRPRGLTLIELEVILVISGILTALGAYAFVGLYGNAQEGRAHDVLAHVTAGQQAAYTSRGAFVTVNPLHPDDDTGVQEVAEHEAGYTTADDATADELVISVGRGTTAAGVPYVAVATTLGDLCALRVAYPTRSGLAAEKLTVESATAVCTADEAAARLAG